MLSCCMYSFYQTDVIRTKLYVYINNIMWYTVRKMFKSTQKTGRQNFAAPRVGSPICGLGGFGGNLPEKK